MNETKLEQKLHSEGLNLASINNRAVAFTIDEILISALFAVIFWDKLSAIKDPQEIIKYSQSLFVYIMAVKVIYQSVFVYMYGATLGKLAMKIRVIESQYMGLPTIQESILRAVMRVVSEMVFYFGFVVAFFSPLRLTWQDRVSKTLVVDV